MFFEFGITPVVTVLMVTLVFAILSDFLLELFSVRLSLSTGRIQSFLFHHIGQSRFSDLLIALVFQFLSFRKKAFFMQYSSLVIVGSFTRRQIVAMMMGSFIGIGLSILLFVGGHPSIGLGLCAFGFLLGLLAKDQLKDLSVAFLSIGIFVFALYFFSGFISDPSLKIMQMKVSEYFAFFLVIGASLVFRTPIAFLIVLSSFYYFMDLRVEWLPALFLLNSLLSFARFYLWAFVRHPRLYFTGVTVLVLTLIQFAIAQTLVILWGADFTGLFGGDAFLGAYKIVVLGYFGFQSLGLILLTPLVLFLLRLSWFDEHLVKKAGQQKILIDEKRGSSFSIHLSLLLMRQEFKKFVTSVHTLFKLSRESDHGQDEINQRCVRYQGMLERVGAELKEICFSIGRQRSYRWQVKEIMSYYRRVNQLELLIEDLGYISELLRRQDLNEEWEKDCRFWLGLQLKLFESFFNVVLGDERDDSEKIKALCEKSYNVLDRFFVEHPNPGVRINSQTFYRVTESLDNLAH